MTSPAFLPRNDLPEAICQTGRFVALLDAANLPGLPRRIGGQAQCLFHGRAAETLRDVAPYLAPLQPDCPLLRDLVDTGPNPTAMWPRRPGMLFRTDLDLPALAKHLRRFLRVSTGHGAFFFRFWDSPSTRLYFDAISDSADRARWFFPREGGRIDAILVPDAERDGLHVHEAGPMPPHRAWERHPFTLKPAELAALQAPRRRDHLQDLVGMISAAFPDLASRVEPALLERSILRSATRGAECGIRQPNHLFRIAAWDLHAGGNFENVDPGAELGRILHSDLPEAKKMQRLADRIATLGPANR